MLTSVLAKSSCSTVADLLGIAQRLELPDFDATVSSFKTAYKILARKIHEFYDVSFAMVEGLHRIFAVRNVLEGLYLKNHDEPYTANVFLQTKIKIRICILDEFTQFISSQYMQYSLFTMKVKKASVDRTVYDELCQIVNELEDDNHIRDLEKNPQLFQQFGRHDKETDHVLFNQRLKVYNFIATFSFDKTRSTVLFNYQREHVNQAVGNHRIPDKHHYLGIGKTTSLSDTNLMSLVAEVIMRNLQTKAEDYTTLSTKQSCRNNCQLMKPLCQQIRIVMSYLVLASVNIPLMKEAISIFSPSFKFNIDQTSNEVSILRTMAKIVESVEHVVTEYRKSVGLGAGIIYTTKFEQLLQMNLFYDILIVVKMIGHHPNMCIDILDRLIISQDDAPKESVLIELLQGWSVVVSLLLSRLTKEKKNAIERWKEYAIEICKGDNMKDTHIRHGKFGTTDFKKYTVDKNLSFSFFVVQVQKNSLDFYDSYYETRKTRSVLNIVVSPSSKQEITLQDEAVDLASTNVEEDSIQINNSNEESSFEPEHGDKCNEQDESFEKESPLSESIQKSGKRRMPSNDKRKKKYQSKKIFNAPIEVTSVYQSVAIRGDSGAPIGHDISTIKQAWLLTATRLKTAADLNNIWQIHKSCLYEIMERTLLPTASAQTDDQNVEQINMSSTGNESNLE